MVLGFHAEEGVVRRQDGFCTLDDRSDDFIRAELHHNDVDYAAVGQAVSRLGKRLEKEMGLRGGLRQVGSPLSNVEF